MITFLLSTFLALFISHSDTISTYNVPHYSVDVNFSLPPTVKRFFIVDNYTNKIVFSTYVAQGSGKGFSNRINSHCSSLGHYITTGVYWGTHGISLGLKGLDKGINDNAEIRKVVIHGAEYAKTGGHSWGCLAIDQKDTATVIKMIGSGTPIYVHV